MQNLFFLKSYWNFIGDSKPKMRRQHFSTRKKIKNLSNLLEPKLVSKESSRVYPYTFSKLWGPYMVRYMLLYVILPPPKYTFCAFILSFYEKQGGVAHIFNTNIKRHVWGRSLCIFRIFGLLVLELGGVLKIVFFSDIAQNGSNGPKQLRIESYPYMNPANCHN